MNKLTRTIHPEIRVLDAAKGLVEYIASDETLDSYREIIRADGWRHNLCAKNFPFVDSHDYSTIEKCLGRIVDFGVRARRLFNVAQFAIDVTENRLAQLAWKMTVAKMLPAVSVGFFPKRMVTKWDSDPAGYLAQLTSLNLAPDSGIRTIYLEQEQIELSLCVIGANPNAVARSYKAGVIDDADLEFLCEEKTKRETDEPAADPADAVSSRLRARTAFLMELHRQIKTL